MYGVIVFFHVVACLALILIVLLQTGRGAEIGAAFGGASQTLFGSSGGSTFLSKLTTGAAVLFMITCLGLTYLSGRPATSSIMQDVEVNEPAGPVVPEARPVQPAAPAQPGDGASAGSQSTATTEPGQAPVVPPVQGRAEEPPGAAAPSTAPAAPEKATGAASQ